MEAIIIKADRQSSKILKELAERLGARVTNVKDEQYEDIMLGTIMDEEKTGKTFSREAILKKLQGK
jgi:hypothetical protein